MVSGLCLGFCFYCFRCWSLHGIAEGENVERRRGRCGGKNGKGKDVENNLYIFDDVHRSVIHCFYLSTFPPSFFFFSLLQYHSIGHSSPMRYGTPLLLHIADVPSSPILPMVYGFTSPYLFFFFLSLYPPLPLPLPLSFPFSYSSFLVVL